MTDPRPPTLPEVIDLAALSVAELESRVLARVRLCEAILVEGSHAVVEGWDGTNDQVLDGIVAELVTLRAAIIARLPVTDPRPLGPVVEVACLACARRQLAEDLTVDQLYAIGWHRTREGWRCPLCPEAS